MLHEVASERQNRARWDWGGVSGQGGGKGVSLMTVRLCSTVQVQAWARSALFSEDPLACTVHDAREYWQSRRFQTCLQP